MTVKWAVYAAIVLVVLIYNAVLDLKYNSCRTITFIGAAIAGIFLSGHPIISILALLSALFMPDFKGIGGADIDAILLVLSVAYMDVLFAYLISIVAGVIYCIVKKTKNQPFVFSIAVGYIAYLIIFFLGL